MTEREPGRPAVWCCVVCKVWRGLTAQHLKGRPSLTTSCLATGFSQLKAEECPTSFSKTLSYKIWIDEQLDYLYTQVRNSVVCTKYRRLCQHLCFRITESYFFFSDLKFNHSQYSLIASHSSFLNLLSNDYFFIGNVAFKIEQNNLIPKLIVLTTDKVLTEKEEEGK